LEYNEQFADSQKIYQLNSIFLEVSRRLNAQQLEQFMNK